MYHSHACIWTSWSTADASPQGEVEKEVGARCLGQSCGQLQVPQPGQLMRCPRQGLVDSGELPRGSLPLQLPLCWAAHCPLSEHLCPVSSDGGWRGEGVGKKCKMSSLEIKSGATFSPYLLILHPVFPCTSLLTGLSNLDSSLLD